MSVGRMHALHSLLPGGVDAGGGVGAGILEDTASGGRALSGGLEVVGLVLVCVVVVDGEVDVGGTDSVL